MKGQFRTPSLRGVAQSAPYMHSGQFATLSAVIDFYAVGGSLETGDPEVAPFAITPQEKSGSDRLPGHAHRKAGRQRAARGHSRKLTAIGLNRPGGRQVVSPGSSLREPYGRGGTLLYVGGLFEPPRYMPQDAKAGTVLLVEPDSRLRPP